ncbi:XrtA system polysaccharide deacetylase [Nitrosomonas halophila]|jgi:polysaccharide deacetylase family protein (PEP-CTERM system associated)|uniref:Polysaccharide deacetylase family protein, PEP-CTERM locus subfamily n=1 Tax=Nitrosomonas halophila TaxID=44576 RepID=A0A1H3I4I3_9PROT|nr:XrtA system polysaccharide deacetylase [Nitrosomonas halophila]SDY22593.1 polysaccharide deacetylase family protein, PEP-CTERM locus subfamily [Nitrosomonas halophila]
MMRNALTIDVEDYFQVSAFSPYIPRSEWETLPCRVERNVDRILDLLDENDIKATFFTLGWIAERYPAMVQQIVANGHELASHGYAHHRVTEMNPAQFRDDIIRSKQLLEDIGGLPIAGYRAPSFSIDGHNLWALDCLEEAGYRYSSSIYPVRHDHYGMPEAPRFAFHPNPSGKLLELPVTTVRMFGRNLPSGGGGYFRLWPYAVSRWCLQRVNTVDRQPVIFYFHPWEIDPDQPRQQAINFKTRFRHYLNLGRMENRLAALTRHFHWGRMDQVFLKQLT